MPVRLAIPVADAPGIQVVMPAYLPDSGALATKIATVFNKNPERGLPLILGVVLLNDTSTGAPLAIMDGAMITALRTAAGSAAATRLLARRDARVVTVMGTGVQAETHLEAISVVRDLVEARIVGRELRSATAFADRQRPRFKFPIKAFASAEEAVRGSDIVVTATTAAAPIVQYRWFAKGAHICGIGSHSPGKRELDGETIARADVLTVDTKAGALAEAGDLQIPIAESLLKAEQIVEVGEVLLGSAPGRVSDRQITLYKSVGMAAMDAVAARLIYGTAVREGLGTQVRF